MPAVSRLGVKLMDLSCAAAGKKLGPFVTCTEVP